MSTLVTYEIKYLNFLNAEGTQLISGNSSEDAVNNLLQAWPGIKKSSIREVRELPKIDEQKRQRSIALGRKRIEKLEPETIPSEQLAYLQAIQDEVKLRFSWPADVHEAVLSRTEELGIPMPEDARPMDSGKFGGTSMYSLSTELSFPTPANESLIPAGTWSLTKDGKRVKISRVTLSLGLRKAGFPVNVYAR